MSTIFFVKQNLLEIKQFLSTQKNFIKGYRQNLPSKFIQIEVDPPPSHPIFDKFIFDTVDHVDLPLSLRIFDKNHEILAFENYVLYYPHYFLRVRDTDR